MANYDNEIYRGLPDDAPTLASDQRPTGAEVYQVRPVRNTLAADARTTAREEAAQDPPKKKSNARRITKAIKLLASCMAAVVITEAAVNMAATIEPPAEVPTGLYYEGQWPGVRMAENTWLVTDMDTVEGNIIQAFLEGKAWRFAAQRDWRILWLDQNLFIENLSTGIKGRLNMQTHPYMSVEQAAVYGEVTASTGETLYFRGFLEGGGTGTAGESLELQQAAMDEFIAGLTVTPATEDGWQGFQIGDKLYSQQSEDWYGLGGYGDLEIEIPWVCDSADYGLADKTPYARETVNGITWSIYFAENDTYLWAVPNIDPELCLGGYVSRFMCADAVRRGEYIEDDEWGGFTSASQRRTAVDILIECLQHHYALRDRWYPRDWPWKGATDDHAAYWVWAESVRGKWVQFSFGDEACRVDSTDPTLRFHWESTIGTGDDAEAELEISKMVQNDEAWALDVFVRRTEFSYHHEEHAYLSVQAAGGEMLYLCFESQYHGELDFTAAELKSLAEEIAATLNFQMNPDDSGWSQMLLCDTMYSPQTMEWSGSGIVGTYNKIHYIHEIQVEGLESEAPCATRTHNGITWSFYYDVEEEIIWAVPDLEPDVCIGTDISLMHDYYRRRNPGMVTDGWNDQYGVPADDVTHAVEAFSECLSHIYPLGVEPEEEWYLPDWPMIGQITADHSYNLMACSTKGTFSQFSLGDASYRMESADPNLCFFWNETTEQDGAMRADLQISHMVNRKRDWRVQLFVQEEPFSEPSAEDIEIDATVPTADGSYLYLRFRRTWWDGDEAPSHEVFARWVGTVLDAITVSPVDPNGWGQVWICDLMTTPLNENWDGNAMVTEDYEIPYFNRAREQGLTDIEPYTVMELNGIVWTFIYEEADDIIWGLPEFDLRPDSQWCIGAPAREMAAWFLGGDPEADYVDAAVEGLAAGLSNYYPRQGFTTEGEYAPVATFIPESDPLQLSLGHRGYRLTSGADGAWMEWFLTRDHGGVMAAEMNMGAGFGAEIYISAAPLAEYDDRSHGQISVDNGESLYWYCINLYNGDDAQLAEFMGGITASAAESDGWGRILIEDTVYSQQGLYWSGWESVEPNGGRPVTMMNLERTAALELGAPIARREINGILWTLYVMEEYSSANWPFIWAVPDVEPEISIGSDYENAVYKYYEDHGLIEDFDGDIWSAESQDGAAEMIFAVLYNYYPQ